MNGDVEIEAYMILTQLLFSEFISKCSHYSHLLPKIYYATSRNLKKQKWRSEHNFRMPVCINNIAVQYHYQLHRILQAYCSLLIWPYLFFRRHFTTSKSLS